MHPIKKLKHVSIQRELQDSIRSVDSILKSLGADKTTSQQDLHRLILNDLKVMKFSIKYDRRLMNIHDNQSIVAFTVFNSSERTKGGIIMLNEDYSKKERFEALVHEYIHIKDPTLPLYTINTTIPNSSHFVNFYMLLNNYLLETSEAGVTLTDQMKMEIYTKNRLLEVFYPEYIRILENNLPIRDAYTSFGSKAIVDKFYQDLVELKADIRTYKLLMPTEEVNQLLLKNAYDVDVVLKKYYFMEKSSVLQWIAINSDFPCHFAWVMFASANKQRLVYDNISYDHQTDPQKFDIEKVLSTPDSVAAKVVKSGKLDKQYSTIDGKEYFCYAYYEKGLAKDLKNKIIPGTVSLSYDRLLVIGWEKTVYDKIQNLLKMIKTI